MKTKHWIILTILAAGIAFIVSRATAQTAAPAILLCSGAHTTCTFVVGAPSAMVATDGFWYTANGTSPINLAAPVSTTAGVTSITINGGSPLTGPVALTIPSKAVQPAGTLTLQ